MFPSARSLLAVIVLGCSAVLGGCASTVALEPAEDAGNPLCADVSVRLPAEISGQARRWTDAQSTGAWGDSASILLTCGVSAPAPTEDKCITIGGVDWIVDETQAPDFYLTTYGRTPAVLVYYDNEVVSGNDVLDTLSASISTLPVDGSCTSTETLLPGP